MGSIKRSVFDFDPNFSFSYWSLMSSGADGGSRLQFRIEIELCLAQSTLDFSLRPCDSQLLMHCLGDF